jgi:hypothetical protein
MLGADGHAGDWTWHTFPGEGHTLNEGPWSSADYQGSDRAEWIAAFGISPVLAEGYEVPFMMMATDLGGVVYSSDGEVFIPADLPYSGGVALGFDPHDGNTGYAIIHKVSEQHRAGLFRTTDRGKTWERLTEADYYRGQRNLICVDPAPSRADHIYMGTKAGVKRSLDDGASWEVLPETADMEIRTLRFNADGSSLYVINGANLDSELEAGDLNLYRADIVGDDGAYTWTLIRNGDARDMHPHPVDPERVLLLNRTNRLVWSSDRGATTTEDITPGGFRNARYVLINPADPEHILFFGQGAPEFSYAWTLDGGETWSTPETVNIEGITYYPGFVDYSPFNHGSANHYLFKRFDTAIQGDRHLWAFWPGQPGWVANWGLNKPKIPQLSKDYGQTYLPFAYGGLFKEHTVMDIGNSDDVLVVARIEQGLVHTSNGGLWWEGTSPHNEPVLGEVQIEGSGFSWTTSTFHGVAIDPEDESHWIGFYGNGPAWIIRSMDTGQSWEKVREIADFDMSADPSFFHRRWVFWHRQDPDIIYVGSWKSTDRGETWTELPAGRAVTDMSWENGDVVLHRDFGNYHVSTNGGENWFALPAARNPATLARYELPNGRVPALAAIDPDPLRDPTVPGQFLRFIIGSREGVLEYNATNQNGNQGTWTLHTEGIISNDDPWIGDNQRIYLTSAVFDPRPGHHHIAYVAAGRGFNGPSTQFSTNDKYYRQIYRSENGGLTWERIVTAEHVASGDMPAYMDVTGPLRVSQHTGRLFVHSWAGMYVYDHEAVEGDLWYGFPVDDSGWANTGSWLGWVRTDADPWIWNESLGKYIYVGDGSGWVFVGR